MCLPLSATNRADIKFFRDSSVFVVDDMLIRYHGYSIGLSPL